MPIEYDIMDHEVIGPAIRKGEKKILRIQLEKRFGSLPGWAEERLAKCSGHEVEDLALQLLGAGSLTELFA